MENKIAVSVVMGVHNPEQEAFLAAVISICRQTVSRLGNAVV